MLSTEAWPFGEICTNWSVIAPVDTPAKEFARRRLARIAQRQDATAAAAERDDASIASLLWEVGQMTVTADSAGDREARRGTRTSVGKHKARRHVTIVTPAK
jgi:hypothetical protein